MRYFLDCEYIDNGHQLQLVSLALVAEDSRELYLVSAEFEPELASSWVRENVLPLLPTVSEHPRLDRAQMRESVLNFVVGDRPEFWAAYPTWDWFLLVRLFGRLDDLPPNWPLGCLDLIQWSEHLGRADLPVHPGRMHDALADARWHRDVYEHLVHLEAVRHPILTQTPTKA